MDLGSDLSRDNREIYIRKLNEAVIELEYSLIPHGLHVVGQGMSESERREMLVQIAKADDALAPSESIIEEIVESGSSNDQSDRS